MPPASHWKVCASTPMIASSPRWACVRVAARLPMVPLATKRPACLPTLSAATASSSLTVGSSP